MKNLFIIKRITENMNISDEAFTVWCGLRNIILKDVDKYFISYNMIAHYVFNRHPNRYELDAIKRGFTELAESNLITIIDSYSKHEHWVDLSALYYDGKEFFADLTLEEMQKIMNISGNHNKYKLLRYFCCQIGTFNRSDNMFEYKGKIGGMGLDWFEKLINISKPTVISFNNILEDNHLLFVIRHKDFYQNRFPDGSTSVREIPNTYSRWCDKDLAIKYAEGLHGYRYSVSKKGTQTEAANHKRSLGQKLHYLTDFGTEYSDETMRELREYAAAKNAYLKKDYEENIALGNHPEAPDYIDMSIFDGLD